MSILQTLVMLVVVVPLFLLPTILAVRKNHPHKIPIILINILGGLFMGVGWFVALVWVFVKPAAAQQPVIVTNPSQHHVADELKKLKDLMDGGVITAEDFEQRKKMLLATGTAS